jgi:glycosyltransferase 2 family protein
MARAAETQASARVTGARASRRGRWLLADRYERHPGDAMRLLLGVLLLSLTALGIEDRRIGVRETDFFRVINDLALPGWTYPPIWLVMQLGVIGAVPLVVALALATRRLRLALDAALAAGGIYLIARLVKESVQRGRPQTLLDGVHILGEPARGLGYVSGHSAVSVALATVASPYLGRTGRRVAWTLAAVVCLARIYVGAHLPLDVLGGAALGWAAGALVHLVLGAPMPRPPIAKVRAVLEAHGLDPAGLEPLGTGRRSTRLVTGSSDLFIKVVVREWRDSDLVYRAWRRLFQRRGSPPLSHRSPAAEVEHEAAMMLLAAEAGVRTPAVLLVTSFGSGAGVLVERRVHGRELGELDADQLDDQLVEEVGRQVDALHRAGIAHRQLDPSNILVDDRGRPWLLDLDRALMTDDRRRLERDDADLREALARLAPAPAPGG